MEVIIATVTIGLIGLLIGIGLVYTGKKFHVEVDERIPEVRECLPGNNCGACGFAGCDAVAEAIVKGEVPVNACPINSAENLEKIGEIMGASAEAAEKKIAFVRCAGDSAVTENRSNYVGISDCRAAQLAGVTSCACDFGCLGYGSCSTVCNYGAIKVVNGVAVVDENKCVGCGMCAKACPRGIIDIIPAKTGFRVRCSNKDRGADVKKVCKAGCLGCTLCTRQCEYDAIHCVANVAQIDYEKCQACGKCAEKCPAKVIRNYEQ